MRRLLNKKVLLIAAIAIVLVMVSGTVGLWVLVNSPGTNERIRRFMEQELEASTGGKTSLGQIRWSLQQQQLVLENLTIRGSEPAEDPPLAHVDSIMASVNLRSLLQRRIDLSELTVEHPEFHVSIDPMGRTNLPSSPQGIDAGRFSIAVGSLKIVGGTGVVNDRKIPIDLELEDLTADLTYGGADVLSATLSYEGTFTGGGQTKVPYKLSAAFDATRGTVLVHKAEIVSGKSTATLMGRIDRAITEDISGQLEYSSQIDPTVPARFFPKNVISGTLKASGSLQFSPGSFVTHGSLSSPRMQFNEVEGSAIRARYDYTYPSDALKLTGIAVSSFGGIVAGSADTVLFTSPVRVNVDLQYQGIDMPALRAYLPWEPKYVVFSKASGAAAGWVENRGAAFELDMKSSLEAYSPEEPGVTAFPTSGSLDFVARPAEIELRSGDLRFFDTAIRASGRISEADVDLNLNVISRNLANLRVLYQDANGSGSFRGTAKGPLRTPVLDGQVVLDGHRHEQWTIRHAEGAVVFDSATKIARMAVTGTVGDTTASVSGTASVDGAHVDLKVQSSRVRASDFASVIGDQVSGIFSGDVQVASINPIRASGHVRGTGITVRGQSLDGAEGDVTVEGQVVEVRNFTAYARGARLTGWSGTFNRTTEAIAGRGDVSSVMVDRFRDLGIPEVLKAEVPRARLQVAGTLSRPSISGDATVENLAFRDEKFPRARMTLNTDWPILNVAIDDTGSVDVSAQINLAQTDYPFDASVRFRNYSLERLSGLAAGTLVASGDARLKSSLAKDASVSGSGTITQVHTRIGQYEFNGTKPFEFNFDGSRLELTEEAILAGALGTNVTVKGSVGLTNGSRLELSASGTVDLEVLATVDPSLSVTGRVAFDGRIGGTTARPTLDGIATLANASLGREGLFTTLSAVNGTIRFSENRVTFDNVEGRASGGNVRFRGTGLIQNNRMEALDVQIDADQVRMRYPSGLRSTLSGTLVLKGTTDDPLLDGNLRIDNMTYRSPFESFLAVFRPGGLNSEGTTLDRLRLSVHVAGNRNISIQNELADISSARIDLDVKGTLGSPSLTGHVETNDGTLLFQGKRYAITRGNIDFIDPLRIDPVVDIQAETDLRDYRVILAVTGRGDRVRVEFRSDPPLPTLEVVSLIAGGKTREELAAESGATSLPTSEQLFQGGAASILVDLLRSRVGSRFGLLGLDRVRIDPYLVGAENNPSARITFSERVTKDLAVTYSQDLASSQQRVIQIEYFISKDLSIVASREESNATSALGLDVRLRKRF